MSTITLRYELPEERVDSERAIRGADWYLAVYEIVSELRNLLKYNNAGQEIDSFNKWVWEMLKDRGLDPYES